MWPVASTAASIADTCFYCAKRQDAEDVGTSCALSIALARVAALALPLKDAFFRGASQSLTVDTAIEAVVNLVLDDEYAARIAGGKLIQIVFLRLSDPGGVFQHIVEKLDLVSNESTNTIVDGSVVQGVDVRRERLETAVFMLGKFFF